MSAPWPVICPRNRFLSGCFEQVGQEREASGLGLSLELCTVILDLAGCGDRSGHRKSLPRIDHKLTDVRL